MSMIATTSELLENVDNCYKEFLDWRNRRMWYQERVKRLPDLVVYAPMDDKPYELQLYDLDPPIIRIPARCRYCGCKTREGDVVCDRCGAPL